MRKLLLGFCIGLLVSCSSVPYEPLEKDLPRQACIIYDKYSVNRTFERVIVLHNHSDTEWEVLYPDSRAKSSYFVKKEVVTFFGCPLLNNIDIREQ